MKDKAILILDMPKDCLYCPCYRLSENIEDCKAMLRPLTYSERDNKPEWCPLKSLGKRVEEYGLETWDTRDGIFLCELGLFDEIYGDDEEDG